MKPTHQYPASEQYDAALAAGITPQQMLVNVEVKLRAYAAAMVAECLRCPAPDYAATFVREGAEAMLQMRAVRAYTLGRILQSKTP